MPCFRGIEMAIVGHSDVQRFPEFPHPDASSVCLRTSEVGSVALQESSSPCFSTSTPTSSSHGDPTCIRKARPTISVYIPSQSGVEFWIRYNIIRPPDEQSYLYFKMFVNGRHATSWGINPRFTKSGYIVRAFYDGKRPAKNFQSHGNGGISIEGRCFCFTHVLEHVSIAEDGGLIEFNVYRAKAKKRRSIQVDRYRDQELYGIACPRIGLLETPDLANYYDWYISDPKDSPYATFRFHYRSWENLQFLNIIPAELSRATFCVPRSMNNHHYRDRRQGRPGQKGDLVFTDFEFDDNAEKIPLGLKFLAEGPEEKQASNYGEDSYKGARPDSSVFASLPVIVPPPYPSMKRKTTTILRATKAMGHRQPQNCSLPEPPQIPKADQDDEDTDSMVSSYSSSSRASVATSLNDYADTPISDDEVFEIGIAKYLSISRFTRVPVISVIAKHPSEENTPHITARECGSASGGTWGPFLGQSNVKVQVQGQEIFAEDAHFLGRATAVGSGASAHSAQKKNRSLSANHGHHGHFSSIFKTPGDFLGLGGKMSKVSVSKISESDWMKRASTLSSSPKRLASKSPNVPSGELFTRKQGMKVKEYEKCGEVPGRSSATPGKENRRGKMVAPAPAGRGRLDETNGISRPTTSVLATGFDVIGSEECDTSDIF